MSHIHAELKENEKELIVLERELAEIDQIERDLAQMTHERDLLSQGTHDASGLPKLAIRGHEDLVKGHMPTGPENDPGKIRFTKYVKKDIFICRWMLRTSFTDSSFLMMIVL